MYLRFAQHVCRCRYIIGEVLSPSNTAIIEAGILLPKCEIWQQQLIPRFNGSISFASLILHVLPHQRGENPIENVSAGDLHLRPGLVCSNRAVQKCCDTDNLPISALNPHLAEESCLREFQYQAITISRSSRQRRNSHRYPDVAWESH